MTRRKFRAQENAFHYLWLKRSQKRFPYRNLDELPVYDLLAAINKEDQSVPLAIEKILHRIETVVILITEKMRKGGRLFYLGAGTSGRLGIVDASELPPTYGLEHGRVIGLIAGGDAAIRKAVEFAEDDPEKAGTICNNMISVRTMW